MSWLTNLRGVVGTLFKIGKADFDSTAVTSPRTLALRDIAGTVALLSDITTYGRSLQEITPTSEGQTSFTVPGGYAVGSTDFLVNGVQLRTTEFTATDGTTVTISAGLSTTDLLTAIKWGNGGATSFTTTAASATAGQTAFTVPAYPTGLSAMAVYRNGVRLTPSTDFVETNSTTVTLTSAADLNDDMLFISGTPVGSFGTMATQNASNVAITGGSIVNITDLVVADGGTGVSSFTDGGVIIGNGTGALQVTGVGTAGQVLTSNGVGADPTFTNKGLIGVQVFTATSTYTPTTGTTSVVVMAVGGGGGGGGAATTGSGQVSAGGGGGAAAIAYARATAGFSGVTITIGAGGAGGSAGNNAGATGGATTFGSVLTAGGGGGGGGGSASGLINASGAEGIGGTASGSANLFASRGSNGGRYLMLSVSGVQSGVGASSIFGSGGTEVLTTSSADGLPGTGFGAGGSGGACTQSQTQKAGGAGSPGLCVVWEYA